MMNAVQRISEVKKSTLFSTSELKQLATVCIYFCINQK